MRRCHIAALILVNGPPGVGKSAIARRIRDDRPLSLLVDFDDLWLLIGAWQHHDAAQGLAIAAGLAMARAHLDAGHDVVMSQFAVERDYFDVIDAIVARPAVTLHEVVLTGHPDRVATQFRCRRVERTLAGRPDVSANIADDRVDEVIAWASTELAALTAARPHATVIPTDGGVEATYARVRDALDRHDS